LLAASLDYETSLQRVVELLVPALADGCFVDVAATDGSLARVAQAGATERPGVPPVASVVQSNRPWFGERAMAVPLMTHAGVAGAFTCLAGPERAPFGSSDFELAAHIARRCSLAIDNSRLYREARAAVSLRDEFLSVAAHELKTPMTSLRGYAQLLAREFERGRAP